MITLHDESLFQPHCFIDNQWVDSANQATTEVYNPANGALIGTVPNLTSEQIDEAINSAYQAHLEWKQTSAEHKSQCLRKWYELMVAHLDDLAAIITTEQGKPFAEAQGEIRYAASFVQWYAEEAKRAYGSIVPTHKSDARILVTKEPVGVVAAITPWNFPAAMITRKCAPAFAAGCSVVLKPAPDTPFSAMALAELAKRAGLPAGLLQVMTADAERIGERFTQNTKVRKLSFTGSTRVGKLLMAQSAFNVKKLSLELGGNAPFIVFDDADLDAAIDGIMIAKFRNSGQTCVCANRIYVHDTIHDEFVRKLVERVATLKVGDGFNGSDIGPLINQAAVDKVRSHIDDALAKGGKLQYGQAREQGLFVEPHIITEMTHEMLVASQETFGPLAAIFRFSTEEEVVERANAVEFGLAAYCYTQSLARAFRMSEKLESGMVGLNEGLISTAAAPFGGVKESGLGREGGHQGLEEFLEEKYTLMGGIR